MSGGGEGEAGKRKKKQQRIGSGSGGVEKHSSTVPLNALAGMHTRPSGVTEVEHIHMMYIYHRRCELLCNEQLFSATVASLP